MGILMASMRRWLAVGQEQIVRNIASLEAAEKDIRHKISVETSRCAAADPALKLPPPATQIVAPPPSAPPPATDLKPKTKN